MLLLSNFVDALRCPVLRHAKFTDCFPDSIAGTSNSRPVVVVLPWPLVCRPRHTRQIRWYLHRCTGLVDEECAGPSKPPHEQAEFKNDVVAWPQFFVGPAGNQIVWCQYEDSKIKSRQC